MREIKFRAWDTAQKQMVAVTDMEFYEGKLGWISAASFDDETKSQNDGDPSYLIPMQYTGLRDQNGKEIYEGDIVRTIEGKMQRVEFLAGYVDDADDLGIAQYRTVTADNGSYYLSRTDEVIGNVYQNPELLEARNDD